MSGLTYAFSGVDIDSAERATARIAELAKETFNDRVLTNIGLFAGAYEMDDGTILLSSADGVGTKTIIADMTGIYNTVGIDLAHHCCNDIAVHNADPIYFLDYIGHSDFPSDRISDIVEGLSLGCRDAGCALIGGETAQMPGIYPAGCFDLVGFVTGRVRKNEMITGAKIKSGDIIIGMPSNGLHTNGYSLARKAIFDVAKLTVESYVDELGETVGEALMKSHTLYLHAVRKLSGKAEINGMAHITGGGVPDNLLRILPKKCCARIEKSSVSHPPIFELIQAAGNIEEREMFRTFNMGFGFLFVVSSEDADKAWDLLGKKAFIAGDIIDGEHEVIMV